MCILLFREKTWRTWCIYVILSTNYLSILSYVTVYNNMHINIIYSFILLVSIFYMEFRLLNITYNTLTCLIMNELCTNGKDDEPNSNLSVELNLMLEKDFSFTIWANELRVFFFVFLGWVLKFTLASNYNKFDWIEQWTA